MQSSIDESSICFDNSERSFYIAFVIVSIVLAFVCVIYVLNSMKDISIRHHSPKWLILALFGTILMNTYYAIGSKLFPDPHYVSFFWMLYVSYCMVHLPILLTLWRLVCIFVPTFSIFTCTTQSNLQFQNFGYMWMLQRFILLSVPNLLCIVAIYIGISTDNHALTVFADQVAIWWNCFLALVTSGLVVRYSKIVYTARAKIPNAQRMLVINVISSLQLLSDNILWTLYAVREKDTGPVDAGAVVSSSVHTHAQNCSLYRVKDWVSTVLMVLMCLAIVLLRYKPSKTAGGGNMQMVLSMNMTPGVV